MCVATSSLNSSLQLNSYLSDILWEERDRPHFNIGPVCAAEYWQRPPNANVICLFVAKFLFQQVLYNPANMQNIIVYSWIVFGVAAVSLWDLEEAN